ncbi:MAG: DUF547 domain-containing protein [Gemmatimonadota bacterium]
MLPKVTIILLALGLAPGAAAPSGTLLRSPAPPARSTCELPDARAEAADLHAPFEALLGIAVRDGVVDYSCFKEREAQLDAYLATLAATEPASLSRDERLALWINAYNAYTIKLILTRYPDIESIKDIPRRWKRDDWLVGGERYSLDAMEHEILRKEFDEPRIHFAIVCASISCPDLQPEAYQGAKIEEQLTRAARGFLTNPEKGMRIERKDPFLGGEYYEVRLSSIFKWFGEDFEKQAGSRIDFVRPYVEPDTRALLDANRDDLKVRFLDYDWDLNGT